MNCILFVDDDIAALDALRLRLRPMRDMWAMTFAPSGPQALVELQQNHYDVVVSDIRMPGMHGARLLRTIGQRWPQTVRIAISGHVDPEPAHVVPVAHRFLSKPCERPRLENIIEHCLHLQELLPKLSLRTLVGRVQRLPPIRKSYQRLQSLLADPAAATRDVAAVINSDTVMTARLLHIVNSSFFAQQSFPLERPLIDIERAIDTLGLAHLREVVSSVEVFAHGPQKTTATSLDLESLQHHINAVAKVGEALTAGTPLAGDTALAARLHDIGYWILLQECPRELEHAFELARAKGLGVHAAERFVLGASHAEVGAYLLGLWGFPDSIVNAVAQHHVCLDAHKAEFDVSTALAIAIGLSNSEDAQAIQGISPSESRIGPEYFESLHPPFDWAEAQRRAAEALGRAG